MIFDADMDVVAGAAERWQARTAIRDARKGQSLVTFEDPGRLTARFDRLAEAAKPGAALQAPIAATPLKSEILREMGLERSIGRSDFQNIAFLELALAVSRFVGRVNIRVSQTRSVGFGTGFMVSPRLLMTNNHVLPSADSARFSEVEFDYQLDPRGLQLQPVPFALQPDVFFLTDRDLDFTLVAVAERSTIDRDLKHYGWSRLIGSQGKIVIGEHVNIIQHPRGQFKQFVDRDNELVDVLENHLHYVTDTEPGSSGSPVYNDQWEVVALHHSGVPRMRDGQYVDKRGQPWDGQDPEDIDWVANEGVRVSKLVDFIQARPLDGEAARLRDDLLQLEPPHPLEAAQLADADAARRTSKPVLQPRTDSTPEPRPDATTTPSPLGAGAVTFTIPLRVTVELGAADAPAPSGTTTVTPAPIPTPQPPEETPPELASALAEFDAAARRPYYDAPADQSARLAYYRGLDAALAPAALFRALSGLVARTHKHELPYAPPTHVYPRLDLRPGTPPRIQSIYSGKGFDPRELIEADFRIQADRERLSQGLAGAESAATAEMLEAALPYNCEHVVPQSWFGKRQPMRGDLHHLFACESGCNSFRGNFPYYDFPDFEEAMRDACGKRETQGFEPTAGKGAIARATLYFLLRYPGVIGKSGELTADRLPTLLNWHRRYPVDDYERHRNAVAAEKQGNRNPLIDHPEWAELIDFGLGFVGGSEGPEVDNRVQDLPAAMAAIAALDWLDAPATRSLAAAEALPTQFGRYEGVPAQVALLPDGRKVKLLAALSYFEAAGRDWPVPPGTIVDGASIPKPFWSLIGGPFEGRYRDASIVHDLYCDTKSRSWRDTHRMFYAAMRCSGVGEAKAKIMYYAVYRFGPRWELGAEAFADARRTLSDADAATILADAEAIHSHELSLDEIENLAAARDAPPTLTETEPATPAALQRARLLVVTGGRGTAEDLEAVAREAATLPGYVMRRFEKKKIRIVACRESVTDFETSLQGQIPRGWEDTGKSWDDVPGTYLDGKKRVVIATVQTSAGRAVPGRESGKHGSVSLTVHESLHGFDYSGGHAALADPTFVQARLADLDALGAYERQEGQAGLEETFAESGARFVAEPQRLQADCPALFGYWRAQPLNQNEAAVLHEVAAVSEALSQAPDAPIGAFERDEDGDFHFHLRAEGPDGVIGHASFKASSTDPLGAAALRQMPQPDARTEATRRGPTTGEMLFRPFGAAPSRRGRPQGRPEPTEPTPGVDLGEAVDRALGPVGAPTHVYERLGSAFVRESAGPSDPYNRMFSSDLGKRAVKVVGNEGQTLEILGDFASELLLSTMPAPPPGGEALIMRRAGRDAVLMLDPDLPQNTGVVRVSDAISVDVAALLKTSEAKLAMAAGRQAADRFQGGPHHRGVADMLLRGGRPALAQMLWIAQPEVLRAPMPPMEFLGCPDPALEVRCGEHSSSVGIFCKDPQGRIGATACLHGTGPTGTAVTLGGKPAAVTAHSEVQDIVFIALPAGYVMPSFGSGIKGVRTDRAPAPEDHVRFNGCTTGVKSTQVSATTRGLLWIDKLSQSKVETPRVVDRGDSGCALVDHDDQVIGFAFRRTGYGAGIEFAEWIWAANALAALGLSPL